MFSCIVHFPRYRQNRTPLIKNVSISLFRLSFYINLGGPLLQYLLARRLLIGWQTSRLIFPLVLFPRFCQNRTPLIKNLCGIPGHNFYQLQSIASWQTETQIKLLHIKINHAVYRVSRDSHTSKLHVKVTGTT